ncbi:MAG: hypothetical protein U0989_04900 [Azonexus sp.]|nr:hypothetical protein [Azonexus sp.]MDZ4314088.1 hypothetical protein [Azonexus sp.]
MSMTKTDLEKNRGSKINGKIGAGGIPDRFGAGAGGGVDKREQRKLDQAAGLIPFACKLPAELVKQVQAQGLTHEGGINALVAELLTRALAKAA